MTTAYSYIRFSTPAQQEGDSLRRHLRKSERYAERHDLTLDSSTRDLGLSAFKGLHRHKGALKSFLSRVEAGEIARGSYLLVENLDRLTREDVLEAVALFLQIINAGITVVTFSDAMEYSREAIIAHPEYLNISVSQFIRGNAESKRKAELLGDTWEDKRDDLGTIPRKVLTRQGPRWLDFIADDPRQPLIGEWRMNDRVEIVRYIYRLCLSGMGKELIARRLNDEGIAPFRNGDGWQHSTVKYLLGDRRVLGEFQPMTSAGGSQRRPIGDPLPGYFPAIIEPDTFYAVQQALQQRYTGATPATKGKIPNLFVGIAKCGACERSMEYRDKRGKRNHAASDVYLICSGCRRSERLCTNTTRHTYATVERAILAWVSEIAVTSEEATRATIAGVKLGAKIAQRDDLNRRLSQALIDREDEPNEKLREHYKARARTLSDQIEAVEAEIAALTIEAEAGKRSALDESRMLMRDEPPRVCRRLQLLRRWSLYE